MLTIRLPDTLEHKLDKLAEQTGRPKNYYVHQAIERFLEEHEDHLIAVARLKKKNPYLSIEDVERQLGVNDYI